MIPAEYLHSIHERLVDDGKVTRFRILRERTTDADATIRSVLQLSDGSKLEFSEYVQVAPGSVINVTTYSYHLTDAHGNLICRWDNAPHYPNLLGFPHHRHEIFLTESGDQLEEQEQVSPSEPMSIFRVLDDLPIIFS